MKYLTIIILAVFLVACQSESGSSASATTSQEKAETKQVAVEKTAEAKPVSEKKKALPKYAGGLTIAAETAEAKKGAVACLEVSVANFKNIISMQYSIQWDQTILQFSNVHGFQLPFLNEQNFGTNRSGEGVLTFIWIDNTLQGQNLPDGSPIYEVCFKVIGEAGQESQFIITDKPTPFESVDAKEQLLPISTVDGSLTVQ